MFRNFACMKKNIILFLLGVALVSCGNSRGGKYQEDSIKVDADTMLVEQKADTLSYSQRDSLLKSLSDSLSVTRSSKKDSILSVVPKNKPKYMNDNRVYAYFKVDSDLRPTEFRLVVQYCGTSVLMASNIDFVGSEQTYNYTPVEFLRQSEMLDTSQVEWEWTDEEVALSNEALMKALADGQIKEMKINGRFSFVRNLSADEKAYLHLVWNTYKRLGGKLPESTL